MTRARDGLLWLPVFEDLLDNAKTWKLAAFIKDDEVRAAGHLVSLWLWSLRKRPSGIFEPDESLVIVKAMRYNGDAEAMAGRWPTDGGTDGRPIGGAMAEIGWLDRIRGGKAGTRLELHDWPVYVGLLRSVMDARKKADAPPKADRSDKSEDHPPATGTGTVDHRQGPLTKTERGDGADENEPESCDGIVRAFAFCKAPGLKAKRGAVDDLRRQGVEDGRIMAAATDPMNRNRDFYDIIRELKPNGGTNGKRAATTRTRDLDGSDDLLREVEERMRTGGKKP